MGGPGPPSKIYRFGSSPSFDLIDDERGEKQEAGNLSERADRERGNLEPVLHNAAKALKSPQYNSPDQQAYLIFMGVPSYLKSSEGSHGRWSRDYHDAVQTRSQALSSL